MTIASEITKLQYNLAASYTAAIEKGATVPAKENFDNLPDVIASITGGGSGGGDLVYAVNNTGSTITSGTKVLLNNHVTTADSYTDLGLNSGDSSYKNVWFIGNRGYFQYNAYLYQVDYDADSGWSYTQLGSFTAAWVDFPDGLISISSNDTILKTSTMQYLYGYGNVPNLTCYIGDGLCVYLNNTDSMAEIRSYDVETQTIGDTALMQIYSASAGGNGRIIKSGDKLFFCYKLDSTYKALIIDLSTYTILGTTTLGTTYPHPAYITGCEVGDLVFCNRYHVYHNTAYGLTIYKINSDYQLELYTPDILSNYGTCKVFYNAYNQTLCLGLTNGVRFFEWDEDSKELSTIPFSVTLPTDNTSGLYYIGDISADRTQAILMYKNTSSKARCICYNLTDDSSEWYADATSLDNYYPDRTLTGIATGNEEDGKYEIATVLPDDTATLTVDVTPTSAAYTITGEAE